MTNLPGLKSLLQAPKKGFADLPTGISILRAIVLIAIASMLIGITRLFDLQTNQPALFSSLAIDYYSFLAACVIAGTAIVLAGTSFSYGIAQGLDSEASFAQQLYVSAVYFAFFGESLAAISVALGLLPQHGYLLSALFWVVLGLGLCVELAALMDMHDFGLVEGLAVLLTFVALPLFAVWLAGPMMVVMKVLGATG